MPRVTAHSIDTHYQSIGKGETTLLLLHGWGNDWQAWSPLIPELSRHFTLLIPDLPGFGQSASPARGWKTHDYTEWLADFLKVLKISQLEAVIGHSYGGKTAAFAWCKKESDLPQLKHGLLLISPSGIPARLSLSRKVLAQALPMIPSFVRRNLLASFREYFYRVLLQESDYISATPFQEATLQHILTEDIRRVSPIEQPLHLCWGENDTAVPLWMAYQYGKTSSNHDIFVVPRAGHFAHHEFPQLTLSWVQSIIFR